MAERTERPDPTLTVRRDAAAGAGVRAEAKACAIGLPCRPADAARRRRERAAGRASTAVAFSQARKATDRTTAAVPPRGRPAASSRRRRISRKSPWKRRGTTLDRHVPRAAPRALRIPRDGLGRSLRLLAERSRRRWSGAGRRQRAARGQSRPPGGGARARVRWRRRGCASTPSASQPKSGAGRVEAAVSGR